MSEDERTPEQIDADDRAQYAREQEEKADALRDGETAYLCSRPLKDNPYHGEQGHHWDCGWINAHLEHLKEEASNG